MAMSIKMSKTKLMDRVKRELNESIENLNKMSDKEVELVPDRFLKKLHLSADFLNTLTDLLADMDYMEN